jgi:class 3 adenylate cyclase
MGNYRLTRSDYVTVKRNGKSIALLRRSKGERFSISLLGLGKLNSRSSRIDAFAAVFDLSGFTNFCTQVDPQLAVPTFMSQFLPWIVQKIRDESIEKHYPEGLQLWQPLPFYLKFLGDGLLVLWDTTEMNDVDLVNIIVAMKSVCDAYKSELLPDLRAKLAKIPEVLRCGLARGIVFSVGTGNDYVGSCINMAARLQKLPSITFAYNLRGVNIPTHSADLFSHCISKKVNIRGIGDDELIGILETEYNEMNTFTKRFYREPA